MSTKYQSGKLLTSIRHRLANVGQNQKVYILPTRFGFLFLTGTGIMLLIGSAYQNNLINLLAFFLLSLALVSMVQTHDNIKGLRLRSCETKSNFSGGKIQVEFVIQNPNKLDRTRVTIQPLDPNFILESDDGLPITAFGQTMCYTHLLAKARGQYLIKRAKISTTFPLGLFYAWSMHNVNKTYFVYPEPIGHLQFPKPISTSVSPGQSRVWTTHGEDFQGHVPYQQGQSMRHIDWKAVARGRTILTKHFADNQNEEVQFNFDELPTSLETEAKLKQLSLWLNQAQQKDFLVKLRLDGETIHLRNNYAEGLKRLALYTRDESAA